MAVFTAKDGAVFYRNTFLHPTTAWGLLRDYEADAQRPTWHNRHDRQMAEELRAAINEAYAAEIAA